MVSNLICECCTKEFLALCGDTEPRFCNDCYDYTESRHRFLNPERESYPDIDIDFEHINSDDVKHLIEERFHDTTE